MADSASLYRYKNLVKSIGKAGVHYLFPSDFEYYACSLELVLMDGEKEETTDFFVFPVMPEQIQYNLPHLTNIRKTMGGISILKNSSFVPRDMVISGNFGRKFKLLTGTQAPVNAISFTPFFELGFRTFDVKVKTGYGALKVLEAIVEKTTSLNKDGRPYRTYFYNPALGHSWVVEITNLSVRQGLDNNMMWAYTLNLQVISPIYSRKILKKSLLKTLSYDNIRRAADILFDQLHSALHAQNW
jgi:hypothetical protein